MKIDLNFLKRVSLGKVHPELAEVFINRVAREAVDYGLDLPHRMAHFLAQIAAETGGFSRFEENLYYSAERLTVVWPSRFPTLASAKPYERKPRELANKVYNGRMGNRTGTNDGYDYRGKDGIQLTGRDNYTRCGRDLGLDLVTKPELLLSTALGLASLWFWNRGNKTGKSLNQYADINDIETISIIINGGKNGLAERMDYYARVALLMLGYQATDVRGFQQAAGLVVDGLAGSRTRAALHVALGKLSETAVRPSPVTEPVKNPELEKPWYKTKEGAEKLLTAGVGTGLFKYLTDAPWQNLAIFLGAATIGIGVYIWNRGRERKAEALNFEKVKQGNVS